MTRDEAVARMQRTLGMRSDLVTELQDALQDAQRELEQEPELPWFLISEVSQASTVVGESRLPLPDDFIRMAESIDGGGLFRFDSTAEEDEQWTELGKSSLAKLLACYQSQDGAPVAYALDDEYFRLFPIPDEVYIIKMVYYYQDDVLSTNIENQWLKYAHELILGKAGQKVAESVRDLKAQETFMKMEATGRSRVNNATVARQEAGMVRQMGGRD